MRCSSYNIMVKCVRCGGVKMVYSYFRPFNLICDIFGLPKPLITAKGESVKINLWLKLWSLTVAVALVGSYSIAINTLIDFDVKKEMEIIPDVIDLIVNISILIINLISSERISMSIHEMFDAIFIDVKIDINTLKLFAYKMYLWYFVPMIIFIILIVMEILNRCPPFILMIRIPTFLSIMHLNMHLFSILALIKVINHQLTKILVYNDNARVPKMVFNEKMGKGRTLQYVLSLDIEFIEIDNLAQFDLKFICKLYDDLTTCVHLLEKCYGLQIFLSIWLMFTSGVVGMTVIVSHQASIKWLVVVKSVLPFFWCFIGCFINDQMSKEVDQTITLIIKCLIDYRCVQSRKPVLETFKELVSNDRLQFTACSLFELSYSMLLGTLLNVITYSIILIQMI